MSVLRSRIHACLPFCSVTYELRTCDPRRTACGLFKYSTHPSFKSSVAPPGIHFSSIKQKKVRTNIHSKCSAAGISYFQDMVSFRDKQARHSVLIELSSKDDIPCVLNLCKSYGDVKNMIPFSFTVLRDNKEISGPNGMKNVWGDKSTQVQQGAKTRKLKVIAEFVHEESVQKLLSDCSFTNVMEVFPIQSRLLRFSNSGQQTCPVATTDEVIDLSSEPNCLTRKEPCSVSEMMSELYEKEKMTDLSTRLRFLSCVLWKDALKGFFPYCGVFPFGSSVNGFGKDSSDLDMMLRLFPEEVSKNPEMFFKTKAVNGNYRILQQNVLFVLFPILQNFIPGANNFRKIASARVPIVKYNQRLLNLECDISVNNMPAVYMSEILFFCGELDPRVRPLVYTVKKWAKEASVTYENPGGWLTNFSLSLLLLFFLQTRPVPILPPLNKVVRIPSFEDYKMSAMEYINIEHVKSTIIGKNKESLGALLQEFFHFLAVFPFNEKRISIVGGVSNSCKTEHSMLVDYPLDETMNVTKNITPEELINISGSAFAALKNLEKNSNMQGTNLMAMLGIKESSSKKIDVRTFFDESSDQKKAVTSVR